MSRSPNALTFFESAIPAGVCFIAAGVIVGMYGAYVHDDEFIKKATLTFCVGSVLLGIGSVARVVRS